MAHFYDIVAITVNHVQIENVLIRRILICIKLNLTIFYIILIYPISCYNLIIYNVMLKNMLIHGSKKSQPAQGWNAADICTNCVYTIPAPRDQIWGPIPFFW